MRPLLLSVPDDWTLSDFGKAALPRLLQWEYADAAVHALDSILAANLSKVGTGNLKRIQQLKGTFEIQCQVSDDEFWHPDVRDPPRSKVISCRNLKKLADQELNRRRPEGQADTPPDR